MNAVLNNMTCTIGTDFISTVMMTNDDDSLRDLSQSTFQYQVRANFSNAIPLVQGTVLVDYVSSTVMIQIPASVTARLTPQDAKYSLWETRNGITTELVRGIFKIIPAANQGD